MKQTHVGALVGAHRPESLAARIHPLCGLPDELADVALRRLAWMAGVISLMTFTDVVGHILYVQAGGFTIPWTQQRAARWWRNHQPETPG